MKLLLDTHVLLWWASGSNEVSPLAHACMVDSKNTLLWSAASSWELAIKFSLGRLTLPKPPAKFVPEQLGRHRIEELPVRQAHALEVAGLSWHHRDPFDRILIAQAQVEKLTLLTADRQFAAYGVATLW